MLKGECDSPTMSKLASHNSETPVVKIRLTKADWAKAWRAMIEVAPVRLIAPDPVYEVLPAHLEVLAARGFKFDIIPQSRQPEKRRHGTAD
jgi:hypothetical protein